MPLFNVSQINRSACPDCFVPTYGINGWEMIARGDYWDLLTHYGLQSVVIFIVVLLGLHLFHEYMTLYFRRKYHPEEFTEKDDEDKD